MTALPVEAPRGAAAAPEAAAPSPDDDPLQPETARVTAMRRPSRMCTLDLSRSRTHDAVLDILKAYKLSGNFHDNLGTVLRDMGVSGMVTYEVESGSVLAFPDCRQVVFTCAENVPCDRFDEIIASIKTRIGFSGHWWSRLLHRSRPCAGPRSQAGAGAVPMCRTGY